MNRPEIIAVMCCSLLASSTSSAVSQQPPQTAGQRNQSAFAQPEVRFFPAGALTDFEVKWFSEYLAAMNEPPLNEQATTDGVVSAREAYRFLWLRTFDHPIVVRLENTSDRYRLVVKELDGKGGYKPGKLALDKSRELSREEWGELARRVKECSFWTMTTKEERSYVNEHGLLVGWGIMDGAEWVLEGTRENKYHIVPRQSPDDSKHRKLGKYRALCLYLLNLAGFNEKTTKVY